MGKKGRLLRESVGIGTIQPMRHPKIKNNGHRLIRKMGEWVNEKNDSNGAPDNNPAGSVRDNAESST